MNEPGRLDLSLSLSFDAKNKALCTDLTNYNVIVQCFT